MKNISRWCQFETLQGALHFQEGAYELVTKLSGDPESPRYKQIRVANNKIGSIGNEVLIKKLKPRLNEHLGVLHIYQCFGKGSADCAKGFLSDLINRFKGHLKGG
jgi:hypothetical protein